MAGQARAGRGVQGSPDAGGTVVSEDADSDVSEDEEHEDPVDTDSDAADTGTGIEGGGQSTYA